MPTVPIPTRRILDWNSFHDVFFEVMGFPAFYGRNMNAWIDCMTSLDSPGDGMSRIHCSPPGVVTLHLENVEDFRKRCPEIYTAIVEGSAFVNYRKLEIDQPPVLALAFFK